VGSRDELIRTTLFDGTIISRTYDAVGRLVSLDDSRDGRIDWEYDILDRVVKETTSQGTVAYAYDTEGRRTTLSAPNGYTVSYGYDAADRVTAITKGSQNFQLGYDAADRMTGMTMPNGIAASYSFDTAGRINRILYQKGTQTPKDFQYTLDVADQITQIAGTPAHTFGDNLVSSSAVNQNNQYTTFGSDTLSHDASGNLKTKGQTTYQWDVRDRLIGISGSGVTASFSYDALGRRTSKTVNGQTLGYQYDGADIIQDSTSQYLQGLGIDDVLSRTTNGNNEYYLKDHLGSTVALADQSGNLATQYSYSPYGQVSKTGTGSSNYYTYTGREDDSTGLYYYRARYYSPDLKRFSAEDPIGFGGGQSNLYGYVSGNPASYRDPNGQSPEDEKLILREFPGMVKDMTSNGFRTDPGPWNNFLSTLGFGFMGCHEQADTLIEKMLQLQRQKHFDATWKFTRDGSNFPALQPGTGTWNPNHWYAVATSSDPSDPPILLDPWNDHAQPLEKGEVEKYKKLTDKMNSVDVSRYSKF
jgi:RHS repeat-associated protein